MSNRDARLLDLFLREAGRDAYLQCRLEFPAFLFAAGGAGHALETSDENTVQESLSRISGSDKKDGEGAIPHQHTPARPSPAPRYSIVLN
jgi:hypothetical protein